ncbi:Fat-like cadherin-related tumor suppressor homolog [Gryllus bimaculatus]|nr:Fat-like cadherin-related tumor suppressor homolog [Gryllus bimaculatus]
MDAGSQTPAWLSKRTPKAILQAFSSMSASQCSICTNPCLNKGSCVQPQTCSCSPGFTGPQCETDINECREKPCDHTCVNTNGSFQCYCHDGFDLQEDGRTCRSRGNITATEAKDLLDYELISQRLLRLEEEMHTKKQTSPTADLSIRELTNKIESMMQRILDLQDQLDNVVSTQYDLQP